VADLRVLRPDDWPRWRELRQLALAESPEAFGSQLADWQGDGDTEERWRDRLAAVPYNVMAFDGETAIGMASGTASADEVELISMYVRPDARGSGVAERLVDAVAGWAAERSAARLVLAVRESNGRARAFYRRLGFEALGRAPKVPGEPAEVLMQRPVTAGD
jgi:ribosomal protein S18 acetylase RimI-like enzyme